MCIRDSFYILSAITERHRIEEELRMASQANRELNSYLALSEKIAEDRERKRIAREIHDTLGHALTGISAGIDAVKVLVDIDTNRAKEQLNNVSVVVRDGIRDVRGSLNKTVSYTHLIKISFEWRRGLRLPRWLIFKPWIGLTYSGSISLVSLAIWANFLMALINTAAVGPKSSEVLPVTISPFGNSRARAGSPVLSALSRAATVTLRSSGVMPRSFIKSSIFLTADSGLQGGARF